MLQKIRSIEEFYCPECREKVILKLGSKRIEHFAHQQGAQCSEGHERESAYHMNGKLQLFQRLGELNLYPALEPYFSSIRQRSDISFMQQMKQYALEFQCSAIPLPLLEKRTKNYRKIKASVLWILGGKNIKRTGANKVSLSPFDYYFVTKSPSGIWFLPAYCPQIKMFILLHHFFPISTKNAFVHLTMIPLQRFTFESLSVTTKQNPFSSAEWRKEMHFQKQGMQMRGMRQYYPLLEELYLSCLSLSLLPPYIGLPVSSAILLETPPLIWQLYFFLDHLWQKKAGEHFTVNHLFQGYVKRLERGFLQERTLPLLSDLSPLLPVLEYTELLEKIGVLEKMNSSTYLLKQTLQLPQHVTEQQRVEDLFYSQYDALLFR